MNDKPPIAKTELGRQDQPMVGLIHRASVALAKKFLPDPMALGLKENIVIRQAPTEAQIKKHKMTVETFEGRPVFVFDQPKNGEPLLYFCHGGGFITGMFKEYYEAVARLQKKIGIPVICADYPMPPETDAQGLLDFNLACFRNVRETYPDSPIIISGDSAGGHMTLTLTQALTKTEREAVSAIFPLFAVVDMSREDEGEPYHKEEALLKKKNMAGVRDRFIGDFDSKNPLISPIYGELSNLPPVHIYSADKDPLYQDSLDLEAAFKASGQEYTHHIFEGYGHDFILFFPTPDGAKGLAKLAAHMRASLDLN